MRKSSGIASESFLLAPPMRRLAPHSLFFLFFNLVYFLPLLGVVLFNYSEGGTNTAADLDSGVMGKITWVYLLGMSAFLCGSGLNAFLARVTSRKTEPRALQLFRLNSSFWVLCSLAITIFVISKVLL